MNERLSKFESGIGLAEKCKREERSNRHVDWGYCNVIKEKTYVKC
jgi:hypothetical protein